MNEKSDIEITEEMRRAGASILDEHIFEYYTMEDIATQIFEAMLAAAGDFTASINHSMAGAPLESYHDEDRIYRYITQVTLSQLSVCRLKNSNFVVTIRKGEDSLLFELNTRDRKRLMELLSAHESTTDTQVP